LVVFCGIGRYRPVNKTDDLAAGEAFPALWVKESLRNAVNGPFGDRRWRRWMRMKEKAWRGRF
jgi:hypothetical protein